MKRNIIIVPCAVFVTALGVSVSYATNFGSTVSGSSPVNQVSLANNKHHRVDFFDTTTRTGNITQWALNNQFPRFDFTWQFVDSSDYDVRVADSDFGDNGAVGWVNCPSGATETGANPNRTCYGQRLNYNLYSGYANGWDTTFGGRFVACHELGHTVGLRHEDAGDNPSCMKIQSPDAAQTNTYSTEDVNHVLNNY
jgi:hypothetical protein